MRHIGEPFIRLGFGILLAVFLVLFPGALCPAAADYSPGGWVTVTIPNEPETGENREYTEDSEKTAEPGETGEPEKTAEPGKTGEPGKPWKPRIRVTGAGVREKERRTEEETAEESAEALLRDDGPILGFITLKHPEQLADFLRITVPGVKGAARRTLRIPGTGDGSMAVSWAAVHIVSVLCLLVLIRRRGGH
ncbi:MAG: hypothetical protein K6E83_07820 [Clostridium sp.]|nr:hypothetical protein [Clostridium sp.]